MYTEADLQPKTVAELRQIAQVRSIDVSDIKGYGSKKLLIVRIAAELAKRDAEKADQAGKAESTPQPGGSVEVGPSKWDKDAPPQDIEPPTFTGEYVYPNIARTVIELPPDTFTLRCKPNLEALMPIPADFDLHTAHQIVDQINHALRFFQKAAGDGPNMFHTAKIVPAEHGKALRIRFKTQLQTAHKLRRHDPRFKRLPPQGDYDD